MVDLNVIYSDPTIVDPAIVATWGGQTSLLGHILDHVLKDLRRADPQPTPENQREVTVPRIEPARYAAVGRQWKKLARQARDRDRQRAD